MNKSIVKWFSVVGVLAASGMVACDSGDDGGGDADVTVSEDAAQDTFELQDTSIDVADEDTAVADTAVDDTSGPDATDVANDDDTLVADVPDTTPPEGTVTFDQVFATVVYPSTCNNGYCHGSLMDDVEQLLAHVSTNEDCETTQMVVPGDPEASLLWRKIAPGIDVCGEKMPKGGPELSQSQADLVYDWILQGAN